MGRGRQNHYIMNEIEFINQKDLKKKVGQTIDSPIGIEIKCLSEKTQIPKQAKARSIGYDLTIPEDFVVPAHSRCSVPLQFAINLPDNIEGKIEARSGFELKGIEGYGEKVVNTKKWLGLKRIKKIVRGIYRWNADVLTGKIDPGYTDCVNVIIKNDDSEFVLLGGTRIAQITFYKVESVNFLKVNKLNCESRGGGLGSSGTK